MAFHIVPIPRGDACDFCTARPIFRIYRCLNFLFNGHAVFPQESANGVWAACRKCAELVDTGRWSDLTDRAVRKLPRSMVLWLATKNCRFVNNFGIYIGASAST